VLLYASKLYFNVAPSVHIAFNENVEWQCLVLWKFLDLLRKYMIVTPVHMLQAVMQVCEVGVFDLGIENEML